MKQKVIQIGSSAGITMSKGTLEELGVKIGDMVETAFSNKTLVVKATEKTTGEQVDPQILQWGSEFIAKNRELLERLKDK